MKKTYTVRDIGLGMMGVIMLMWLAGEAVFRWLLPEYGFSMYPAIPALFLIFAAVLTISTAVWGRKVRADAMPRQKVVVYFMAFKMAKLLVSVAAILCYVKLAGENKGAFLVTFAIYYLVFIGLETFAIYSFERRHNPANN